MKPLLQFDAQYQVYRGVSWLIHPASASTAYRYRPAPTFCDSFRGFRRCLGVR